MVAKNGYEDQWEGTLESILFRNEETGFTVAKVSSLSSLRETVITGILPGVNIGEKLILKGNWTIHPEYGQQFRVSSYQVEQPVTSEGIVKFLSSSLIRGIGPKTAEKIVAAFGEKSLAVIENEPVKLETVEGIGKAKREMIEKGWSEKKEIKNVMIFLQKYDIRTSLATKIYKTYGDKSFQILRSNPYRLTEDIYGIGFKTADGIARNFGIERRAPHRVRAGLIHLVKQYAEEGHCYILKQTLLQQAGELLNVDRAVLDSGLQELFLKKLLIAVPLTSHSYGAEQARREGKGHNPVMVPEMEAEETAVYHPVFYYSERNSADKIQELLKCPANRLSLFKGIDWGKVFDWLKGVRKIEYSEMQKKAIRESLTNKMTVLTGGPGTGKSTITAALTAVVKAKKLRVVLAAPTGRAAKKLNEVTGCPAQTIHRLLEFSWQGGLQFRRNEQNPLEAALIIIDEVSMIDIIMLNHLLKAVRNDTHLVLIGDVDQLPSVGAGYVLNDLIKSSAIPVIRLNQIFRQEQDSSIVFNAHQILRGKHPVYSDKSGDFFFFRTDTPLSATETIKELVSKKIPRTFGYEPQKDIQVLVPMHKGEAGITELNGKLQEALNPYRGDNEEIRFGEKIYRVNDRVIQLRNNYEKDVFNGDLGLINHIDREAQVIRTAYDSKIVEYELSELDQITLSYAISIHKSQGSEFPVVVVPLLMQHFIMLQRNLLYTAVTRAQKMVVLVGNRQAIDTALRNNRTTKRNTMLAVLLKNRGGREIRPL